MTNIVLTGLNGYGEHFIEQLLDGEREGYQLVAVVSRNAKKSRYHELLLHHNVGIYQTIEECLEKNQIDLAIIATPMHIHYREVMAALNHGANVYCEKPLVPTIDECLEIERLAKEKQRFVAVGFQWSYSEGIRALKKDILSGKYKKIKRIKTLVRWTRPKSYFEKSAWKGKLIGENGEYILDNVMGNVAAHFLHNVLFLAGSSMETAATPVFVEGAGYQAHNVEGYDTVAIRISTEQVEELLYYATIVSPNQKQAIFEIEFEDAHAIYPANDKDEIMVETADGEKIYYPSPELNRFSHFLEAIKAASNNERVICDVTTVIPFTTVVNAALESIPVKRFSEEEIIEDDTNVYVKKINERLEQCYDKNCVFKEIYKSNELRDYRHFNGLCLG